MNGNLDRSEFISYAVKELSKFFTDVVSRENPLGSTRSCIVDFETKKALGRFTYWENGSLGVEVLDKFTGELVWSQDTEIRETREIDDAVSSMTAELKDR